MAIQHTDGSFSETVPFDEAVVEFHDAVKQGTARALFVGTENEIEQIKKQATLKDQIRELVTRMDKLEESPTQSDSIVIPTRDEILKVNRGEL